MSDDFSPELRRSRFLLMLGSLPVAGCAQRSLLPAGMENPLGLGKHFRSTDVELSPTVGFPLLRPDGSRPPLRRAAEPFAPRPRSVRRQGFGPDGSQGSTTVGHITTYGYYDEHYYETYWKTELKLQIYVSAPNNNGLPKKWVNPNLTSKITIPNSMGSKMPWKLKYVEASKDVSKGKGWYKITRNSNGKLLLLLNTESSPAQLWWPGGWELNCPGAWAFAWLEIGLYDFYMGLLFEELAGMCGGIPECVAAAWDYTQEAEQQYETYMKDWAQSYCDSHGDVRLKHGIHPADSSGNSSGCSGSSSGSGPSSFGGPSSSGGYGGGSGCGPVGCGQNPQSHKIPPLRTLP